MNKIVLSAVMLALCTCCFAEEECCYEEKRRRYGRYSTCVSREASVLSMMGWGIGLFAGIAILCSLIDANPSHTPPTTTTTP